MVRSRSHLISRPQLCTHSVTRSGGSARFLSRLRWEFSLPQSWHEIIMSKEWGLHTSSNLIKCGTFPLLSTVILLFWHVFPKTWILEGRKKKDSTLNNISTCLGFIIRGQSVNALTKIVTCFSCCLSFSHAKKYSIFLCQDFKFFILINFLNKASLLLFFQSFGRCARSCATCSLFFLRLNKWVLQGSLRCALQEK